MGAGSALAVGTGMTGYWPWWAGALSLGLITAGYTLWAGRSLGVSGAWDRVVHWRDERRVERLDAEFADDAVLVAALVAATSEEFRDRPAFPGRWDAPRSEEVAQPREQVTRRRPLPVPCHAALLISIYLGGLLAATVSGRYRLRLDMGEGFSTIVTGNRVLMVVLLFVGGLLVGFGTRLAGGCSSGHGLSGCSRLQPASILATIVFFGTAVVVSLLLWKVI